mmetsp:Transcript_35692/g.82966  ORF Transcript_35692/g.82966 Transcript_35692/m.82966 type:complete len:491 (+) Transcript_35692:105-1577(+)
MGVHAFGRDQHSALTCQRRGSGKVCIACNALFIWVVASTCTGWSAAPFSDGLRPQHRNAGRTRKHRGRCVAWSRVCLSSTVGSGPLEDIGGWWNDTFEFWRALEIWESTPLREDQAAEAVALIAQLDEVNATLLQLRAEKVRRGSTVAGSHQDDDEAQALLGALLEPLPGLLAAYYWMRITRTLSKRVVKRGLSSSVLYANVGLIAVFLRVVAPRLLAANSLDELFDAAGVIGIPDRATLASMLSALDSSDFLIKLGLYTLAFVVEKLTMVSEILPIQVGLKTLAPLLFGGLFPGAIASAFCETLGAVCNFTIGRVYLTTWLGDVSVFDGPPVGKAKWYGALSRAAKEDGLRLVLLLRLAPVLPLPFDSYWYLLGALPVRPTDFVVAHFLGCLKTAFLDASFGMLLLTSVRLEDSALRSEAQSIVFAETAAFAVVAVLVGTVANRLVNDLLSLEDEECDEEVDCCEPLAGTPSLDTERTPPLLKVARPVD